MLLLLSPHLALIAPGISCILLGLITTVLSIAVPAGIHVGSVRWLPVYFSPMFLIVGSETVLLGAIAAYRSPLTPPWLRRYLAFLGRPSAVDEALCFFAICLGIGILLDAILFVLWVGHLTGASLLGVAGFAVALIVIGACGIATLFAAEYAKDQLGW